jgi:A/G-specific adenine glycosylase
VLSRFFGIATPIDSTEGKKKFTLLAQQLLDKEAPGQYNQTLMDFGATVCKPALPACITCPLSKKCQAFAGKLTGDLPVKSKKIVKKSRWLYYLLIKYKDQLYVRMRGAGDIWENLYEFVLVENNEPLTTAVLIKKQEFTSIFGDTPYSIDHTSQPYRQQLTHQTIHGHFISISLGKPLKIAGYKPVSDKNMRKLAFPKFITHYLTDKKLTLNL